MGSSFIDRRQRNLIDLTEMSSNSTTTAEAAAAAAAGAAAMKEALRVFNTELWTHYAFGVAFTMFRTYARVKAVGWRDLRPDDYLVWLAIVSVPILRQ